jgi:hypothetical protein
VAGADPTDRETFTAAVIPRLRIAVEELSWLLGRGYAEGAAATLVGDHHQLDRRQRLAIRRCACTDAQRAERAARRVAPADLGARPVAVDGFNQLVTIERGLAGGAVLRGRDGALRDVAGVHGSWRRSDHTAEALRRLTRGLVGPATFVLDAPVSNAGRLATAIRELAGDRPWTVELSDNADRRLLELAREGAVLATSDGALLDRCEAWVPLVERALGDAWVVDLADRA